LGWPEYKCNTFQFLDSFLGHAGLFVFLKQLMFSSLSRDPVSHFWLEYTMPVCLPADRESGKALFPGICFPNKAKGFQLRHLLICQGGMLAFRAKFV
jgi:hypothetical protein